MTELVTHSRRQDESTGVIETLAFSQKGVFTVSYAPSDMTKGAVVMAPTLLTDRVRLYRTEVQLARAVAAAGFAVVRFDYRGFGQSQGVTGSTRFSAMLEDLTTATEMARALAPDRPIYMVGTRVGALVVACSSEKFSYAVLWDPVLSGSAYFRNAFRAHMVGMMSRSGSNDPPPRTQLKDSGWASVLGYSVSADLVTSLETVEMVTSDSFAGVPVLWLEPAPSLSEPRKAAVATLRDQGADLDVVTVVSPDEGWFVGGKPYEGGPLASRILEWFEEVD